jgi:L-alanine-DL-glutamate epimerase-like enolase superfamily enzyme
MVSRPLVLVALTAEDGIVGHGEAAPLPEYDGVTIEAVLGAVERYRPLLERCGPAVDRYGPAVERYGPAVERYGPAVERYGPAVERCEPEVGHETPPLGRPRDLTHEQILTACAALDPLPQALAAVDLALWDLAGQRAGQPVWELLGGRSSDPITVNATIGSVTPRDAADEAAAAARAGFTCVKVKVGTPDDRQRLAAVRDAVGPDVLIRVDANGAWDQLTAPERIRALSRFDIELFEEPVHGVSAVQDVARQVPGASLALDESAAMALGPRAREASGPDAQRVCDSLCLKVAACGGITGLIADATRARELGYQVYLASTLDGPLGIAAALHAAAVVGPDRQCGLATLDRFDREPPLRSVEGTMALPAGPGLGDGLLAWYDAGPEPPTAADGLT